MVYATTGKPTTRCASYVVTSAAYNRFSRMNFPVLLPAVRSAQTNVVLPRIKRTPASRM